LHPLAGKNADSFISSAVQLRTLNYRIRIVFVRHHHTPAVSVTIGLFIQWKPHNSVINHQQDTWWYVMVLAKMHQFSKFFTRRFLRNARLPLTQGMFLFLWYFVASAAIYVKYTCMYLHARFCLQNVIMR